jgi:threonine synthase
LNSYFYIYTRLQPKGKGPVIIAIPTGAMGNSVAGFFAQRMGLNIQLILGTNDNDVIAKLFETGALS